MKLIGYLIKEKMEGRKQNGEKAKWRNFEAKWRKNCCAIKIQKKLNIPISLNFMNQIALFSPFSKCRILHFTFSPFCLWPKNLGCQNWRLRLFWYFLKVIREIPLNLYLYEKYRLWTKQEKSRFHVHRLKLN